MKTLDRHSLAKAKTYIEKNSSPLALSLFNYRFGKGGIDDILSALSSYQNQDGGFGHGLEPDFLLPNSSPMATSVAFGILAELATAEIKPDKMETMIKNGINYLFNTFDPERNGWYSIPSQVNDHPHAPWWHYDEEGKGTAIDSNWGNPTADIVGYLVKYKEFVPEEWVDSLQLQTLKYLQDHSGSMEMHELYCFLRFANQIAPAKFETVRDKLMALVHEAVTKDPEAWKGYAAQPLDFVKSPRSFLYPSLKPSIEANLDFWIDTMTADSVWFPAWSWGQYEEAWEKARKNITGMLTVERLKILKSFGRIEV